MLYIGPHLMSGVQCGSMSNVWSNSDTSLRPVLPLQARVPEPCQCQYARPRSLASCQVEYERVKEAYVNMTHSLEASAAEKRALEVRLGQAAADTARDARENRYAPGVCTVVL